MGSICRSVVGRRGYFGFCVVDGGELIISGEGRRALCMHGGEAHSPSSCCLESQGLLCHPSLIPPLTHLHALPFAPPPSSPSPRIHSHLTFRDDQGLGRRRRWVWMAMEGRLSEYRG